MTAVPAVPCPCGASDYRKVAAGVYQRGVPANLAYSLYACRTCNLVRTSPVPDASIYDGLDFKDELPRARDWLDDTAARDVTHALRHVMPDARSVLDIGCNTGELVAGLGQLGWNARGCDIDAKAVAVGQARGRDLFAANLETGPIPGAYDGVILIHTLEHCLLPGLLLANLASAIVRGGIVHIRVPNYGGVLPRVMRSRWGFLMPFQHVWQFTPDTLKALVLDAGHYEAVSVAAPNQLEPRSAGRKGAAKAAIGRLACLANRGDEICATFRRV